MADYPLANQTAPAEPPTATEQDATCPCGRPWGSHRRHLMMRIPPHGCGKLRPTPPADAPAQQGEATERGSVWCAACLICGAPVCEHADSDHTPVDPAQSITEIPVAPAQQDDERAHCLNCTTSGDPDARRVHPPAECPWRPETFAAGPSADTETRKRVESAVLDVEGWARDGYGAKSAAYRRAADRVRAALDAQ